MEVLDRLYREAGIPIPQVNPVDWVSGVLPDRQPPFGRRIFVPPRTMDRCDVCSSQEKLRVCGRCASSIYCSKECQRRAWKAHKASCLATQQVNLRVFYPFIAYIMEYLRNIRPVETSHRHPHPAFNKKIVKSPRPGVRRGTDEPLNHVVVLGDHHTWREGFGSNWWSPTPGSDANSYRAKLLRQCSRETRIFETVTSTCLTLLTELYMAYFFWTPQGIVNNFEKCPVFRLEYGKSPIADFGICKGRVQGNTNRLQTWTYYEPRTNSRVRIHDPNEHYWIYFKTIHNDEITLDCCSYSFGMETSVDASECLRPLAPRFRIPGSVRTPAYFRSPHDSTDHYTLIEDKRFSVMHDADLHYVLAADERAPGKPGSSTHSTLIGIRNFMQKICGRPCADHQVWQVIDTWDHGNLLATQVLIGRHWFDWARPKVHQRNIYDDLDIYRTELEKGSATDPSYTADTIIGLPEPDKFPPSLYSVPYIPSSPSYSTEFFDGPQPRRRGHRQH